MKEVQQIIDKNREFMVIPDGIVVIGKDCKIIVFNEAAARITGYDEEEIISHDYRILFMNSKDHMKYIFDSLTDNRTFTNLSIDITDSSGNNKNVLASVTPVIKAAPTGRRARPPKARRVKRVTSGWNCRYWRMSVWSACPMPENQA